ncbi:bifunctional aminoglycoside phosphotransferase/ATP-binding protein [Allosalinactinospora lopnorensis]|uniref:bifunctional aminoglycoside phosphotransferase/ATP-binding protein n=1 Tax=Allosalinactinospora lopnorensis TaxID=1352348 RepID=UPI000AD09318|nr:AAA family ATPase [Allosalinactinospora lopnorensis]
MPHIIQESSPYADVYETHAGVVFLVGEHAYKLKKPEDFGFLDYSTRELRRTACHREVQLNRRLAPDVYEGVLDVTGADGRPVDHLVAMRRMPAARRLSTLVREGADVSGELRRLAHLIAAFHSRAERGPEISKQGAAEALRGRWADNIAEAHPFQDTVLGGRLEEIERLALRFVDGRHDLFRARIDEGRIVDGHGDLLTNDVFCLDDGPRVLDCLEFDDRLRRLDGLDDAAFLAMDLERLGAPRLGASFTRSYASFAGDPAPDSLHHHYVAYRALVRAKVACLRHEQGDGEAGDEARLLEQMAQDHLRSGAVRLFAVGGTPATGKTTFAERLADRLGAVLLSSDRIRKESAGLPPLHSAAASYGEGIYTAEATRRVYDTLLERGRGLLDRGESVVLDASWSAEPLRRAAGTLAEAARADFVQLRCTAPQEVVDRRLAERAASGGVSDAGPAVAQTMVDTFAPWPESTIVDTSRPMPDVLAQALAASGLQPDAQP